MVLVNCSTRAATLTVSPIRVNSSCPTADGARDHQTGVDTDADSQRAAESLDDEAVNQHRRGDRGVGMILEIVGGPEHGERAIAEELVDVPAGFHDGRHNDLEKSVEARDGVLRSVCLGEGGEVADVDEHHRDIAALTRENVATLLEQSRRQGRVDVSSESGLKSLPLSQTGLHAVKRRRQRAQVIVLNHGQTLAVITGRNTFRAFGKIANRSKGS